MSCVLRSRLLLNMIGLAIGIPGAMFSVSAQAQSDPNGPSESSMPTLQQQISDLDKEVGNISDQEQEVLREFVTIRSQADDVRRRYQSLSRQLEQIEADQRRLESELQEQTSTAREALAKQQEAAAAAEAARKLAAEAEEKAAAANKAAEDAANLRAETHRQLTELSLRHEPLQVAIPEVQQDREMLEGVLERLEENIAALQTQRRDKSRTIESLFRDAGQWISFSDQIAPIFHQRCLVCHNARNARGQFNMATYASILSSGESGGAIDPGDGEASLLCVLVNDGSMPQEAEPLTAAQIGLIQRWVDLGARIDSAADPDAPLIRIMPRIPQPLPPETYHAPVPVTALAVHPEGNLLASSGYHEILIFSLPDGKLVRRIANVAQRVNGLSFHPDGRRLAVASGTPGQLGEVKIFDCQTSKLLSDRFVAEDEMFCVAFSPDGRQLAAGGADGTIAVFRKIDSAQSSDTLLRDHSDWVSSVAWSADGKSLVSASRDKTAKVFDAMTGERVITFNGHAANVTGALFLPDGKKVVSIGDDRHVRVWNVADAKETEAISGFREELTSLQLVAEDGIVTVGADQILRVHNVMDGTLEREISGFSNWLSTLAVAPDHSTIFVGDHTGRIALRDLSAKDADTEWLAVPQQTTFGID